MRSPAWTLWIGWVAATATAAVAMTAYAFSTFETQVASTQFRGIIFEQLKTINEKLDRLIERR